MKNKIKYAELKEQYWGVCNINNELGHMRSILAWWNCRPSDKSEGLSAKKIEMIAMLNDLGIDIYGKPLETDYDYTF